MNFFSPTIHFSDLDNQPYMVEKVQYYESKSNLVSTSIG